MKKLIVFAIVSVFMAFNMSAGEELTAEQKAQQKALKKYVEHIQDSLDFVDAQEGVNKMNFVLTANTIDYRGFTYQDPSPSTNFVLVTDGKCTIQVASNNGELGLNGLGGITLQGNVNDITKSVDKKGNLNCKFSVNGPSVSATVELLVWAGCNKGEARITPTFLSGSFVFTGPVLPYEQNSVFKGSAEP